VDGGSFVDPISFQRLTPDAYTFTHHINPYMDHLANSFNEHPDLPFHLSLFREASKSFEILSFPRSALASFSTRHFPIAISSFKTLTDIAKPRLARHIHHLILDFHSGKAIPQDIPHVKFLLSGTAF
jgi:hypothetical protein